MRVQQESVAEVGLIVDQLRLVHEGGAWHGPSLREALDGMSAAEALRHPIGAAHSAWEIVHHARVTSEAVRSGLTGKPSGGEPDWPTLTDTSDAAWRAELARLESAHRGLRDAVSKLPATRLHETIPGKKHSYWHELLGLLHHDAYHAGQISLLRKGRDVHALLAAPARSPEIPESADAYGWLVGSWELDVRHYFTDVKALGLKAEAHFAWVLEGRAVQDVWIMPRAAERTASADKMRNMFGTTLRVWDPQIQAWRVTWINPVSNARNELVGRWHGKDVVQVGTHSDGTPIRWLFTDITPDSFRWTGEALEPDARTWTLQGEFLARRV